MFCVCVCVCVCVCARANVPHPLYVLLVWTDTSMVMVHALCFSVLLKLVQIVCVTGKNNCRQMRSANNSSSELTEQSPEQDYRVIFSYLV